MSAAAFDWRTPDYSVTLAQRAERLKWLRSHPDALPGLCAHYAANIAQFITDWGTTTDPRLLAQGLPATIPFLPWPRQLEWLQWALDRWRNREPGITLKSRDSGMSWLSVALSCTLALFNRGMVVGFGSRKLEYVDQLGAPKSLFEKARLFMAALPGEFTGGWDRDKHAPHCRVFFPNSGSVLIGESGDEIGRGDRAAIYWLDEAAYLDRAESIYRALSATTPTLLEISTPRGLGNPFSERWHGGKIARFEFRWDADPRKTPEWLERQRQVLDPTTLAQEVLCDFQASADNVICPAAWVAAAVGAAAKLGIAPRGVRRASFDVADLGKDLCCLAACHGIEVRRLQTWSGAGSDIIKSTRRAFDLCDEFGARELRYDGEGMGSGVRAACAVVNQERAAPVADEPFFASGAVVDPTGDSMAPGRTHADLFLNARSQAWWALRLRFQATYKAVVEGASVANPDLVISLDEKLPELDELLRELSQPQYALTPSGKIQVDKSPPGTRSPNRADAIAMLFAPAAGETGYFSALLQGENKDSTANEPQPVGITLPGRACCCVASIAAGVPPHEDVIAVVYWAWAVWVLPSSPLVALDWHVEELAGDALTTLLTRVRARLGELIVETGAAKLGRGILIDSAGIGAQLWADAFERGLENVDFLDEHIAALDLTARAVAAAGHVLRGKVKCSAEGARKTATLKATTKNWLTPILGFSARQSPELAGPLLACVANMVLDTFVDDKSTLVPKRRIA
jgi:hypothetical protein